jgi:hypothetical protein
MTIAQTLLARAASTTGVSQFRRAGPRITAAAPSPGVGVPATPPNDNVWRYVTFSATYSTVTTAAPTARARGTVRRGASNSFATYVAAFHPLYVNITGTSAAAIPMMPPAATEDVAGTDEAAGSRTTPATTNATMPMISSTASVLFVRRDDSRPATATAVNARMSPTATSVVGEIVRLSGPAPTCMSGGPPTLGQIGVRYRANPTALAAIAPEKPAMKDVHPERNPATGPNASRR